MARRVEDLVHCVNANDSASYLLFYLQLIDSGCTLTIPQSVDIKSAAIQWKDEAPALCQHGTDAFFQSVAKQWVDLLEEQGGKQTKNLIGDCVETLLYRQKNLAAADPSYTNSARSGMDPHLNQVAASISTDYQHQEAVSKQELQPKSELKEMLMRAVKEKDADLFLNATIQWNLQSKSLRLPQSSTLQALKKEWRHILTQVYKLNAKESFVEAISQKWFYCVNAASVPHSKEALYSIWVTFKKEYKERPTPQEKKKGWLAALFG